MTPILTLLVNSPYLIPIQSFLGWAGWLVLLGLIIAALIRWRDFQSHGKHRWLLVGIFIVLVPITNLFLGMQLPSGAALPYSGIPSGPHNPVWMFFSAIPWMLAGGFLGPVDAVIVGVLTGLTRGLWDTHSLFTILEPALLALLFSMAASQRYRTLFYRLIRQPL